MGVASITSLVTRLILISRWWVSKSAISCQLRISNTSWCCPQTKEQAGAYRQDCHVFFVCVVFLQFSLFFSFSSHPAGTSCPERLKTDRMEGSEIYVIILWSFTAVLEILLLTAVGKLQCPQLDGYISKSPAKTLNKQKRKNNEEDLLKSYLSNKQEWQLPSWELWARRDDWVFQRYLSMYYFHAMGS